MPDVYATITEADSATQQRLAEVLELRAAEPAQRAMLEAYTAELELAPESRLLEIGCGTGAVCRYLATLPNAGAVVGVDPSPAFVERGRELSDDDRVELVVGDGRDLEFDSASFDVVVCHTTLCHVPGAERVIAEAHRLLRPAGELAVFDGDYATTTVAIRDHDPLQACAEAAIAALVHDPWLMRGIGPQLAEAGFAASPLRGHSYIQTGDAGYMLTIVERGADALAATAVLSETGAEALKAEAQARVKAGTFFGHIAYASTIARRQ